MTEPRRPRILVVTRNLPPLLGGMERLNWHMLDELAKWADVRVVGPAGAAALAPASVDASDVNGRSVSVFLLRAAWRTFHLAAAWRPDVVLAGSGLTAPLAWLAARRSDSKAMAYVHGLDIVVPHAVYRRLWLPFIRRMDRLVANSAATASLAIRAGVRPDCVGVVHPGVDLPAPDGVSVEAASAFRRLHGFGQKPLLLSVGRLTRRKGLVEFVRQVLPAIVAVEPEAQLVVAGDAATDALYGSGSTTTEILDSATAVGLAGHVHILGRVTENELQAAYAASNVHVFPVLEIQGNPEGFGMVAVEAAAHGLPTAAYASGGIVEAVDEGASGALVPPGDAGALADAVLRLLHAPPEPDTIRLHALQFRWDTFGEKLRREVAICQPQIADGGRHA